MKCGVCKAVLSRDNKFCFQCGTNVSGTTKIVTCGGKRKNNGTACGAELKESYKFCRNCGKKVDKSLFQKKQIKCEGKREDGSVCGNLLEEDETFCIECGTPAPVSSEKGEDMRNKEKNQVKGNVLERLKKDLAQSIEYCLPKLFQDLSNGQLSEESVKESLTQFEELLPSLKNIYFENLSCYSKSADYERQISETILLPMLHSFEKVPLCNWNENQAESERRMLLAVSIVSVLNQFKMELNTAEEELLARGLLVRPKHETKMCYDLACIDKYFPMEKKRQLNDYLISFINSMARKAESPMMFCCLPLHHFLSGALKPFDRIPEDISYDAEVTNVFNKRQAPLRIAEAPDWWGIKESSQIAVAPKWWGIQSLSSAANSFQKCLHSKYTLKLDQLIIFLHPLFELDYLLPRTLMAMLKLEMVAEAIKTDKIPYEVCAATLYFFVKKQILSCDAALLALRDVCKASVQKPDESSRQDLIQARMFYQIAGCLVKEIFDKTRQYEKNQSMVADAVQILLKAVSSYDVMHKRQNSEASDTPKPTVHLMFLEGVCNGVKSFSTTSSNNWLINAETYLRRWGSILAPSDLPSETVKEAWNSNMEKELWKIFCKTEKEGFSQLFFEVHNKLETFHPCVQNCFWKKAFSASYNASNNKDEDKLVCFLYERVWEKAMKVKDMDEDILILQHILTWTPFSHYLYIFYGSQREKDLPSQLCVQELNQAISVIKQRVHALENGTVALVDLSLIKDAERRFQVLTQVIFENSEEKKGKIVNVAKAVQIRQTEVNSYLSQKNYVVTLLQLCQHIPSVQTSELDKIIRQLNEKKDLCIRDICQPADVETTELDTFYPQITAHKLSAEVISMLEPMHELYGRNIFLSIWQSIGCASRVTTLDELYKQVWKPSISKMREITQKLVNGDILFVDIEKYFGQMYGDNDGKMMEKIMLIDVPYGIARERVKQLKQYQQLEIYVEGAKIILNVAQEYKFSGDFDMIKKIALQQITVNMMRKGFDDLFFKVCSFLEDLTPEKTKCLDDFIKCKDLVLWLRDSMKGGLKELKVFVEMASISAREGGMEIAKVKCLHAATTGYASLIFDLKQDSGCEVLLERCKILWKELEADPDLPKKLLDTSQHLEWLMTVKEAVGSVEVTSLSQAEAINSKGIFCIGALDTDKDKTMGLTLKNTLQLTVPDFDKQFQGQRQYTYEQLQNLHRILMLVAGKAEQGKDGVARFMMVFDNVIRLANAFIKLNLAGCFLFKYWQIKILCSPKCPVCAFIDFGQGTKPLKGRQTKNDDVTVVVTKLARFMENCMDEWMVHINQKRLEYCELDYIATDQLVILQQELARVGPGQNPDIKIYPFLSAVKENCTYDDLVDAMRMASKDVKDVQIEVKEFKEVEEDEEIASDVAKEEAEQTFIKMMNESGFSEKLAEAALLYVKPDEITEGIIWCSEHLDDEDLYTEKETVIGDGEKPAKEVIPYEGWKKSDQSVMSITASILNRLEVAKGDMDVDQLTEDLNKLWEEFLPSTSSSMADYLSVEHLGLILRRLAGKAKLTRAKMQHPVKISRTPSEWTIDDVIQHISASEPALVPHTELFRKHEIDGKAFLLLNSETMLKYMGLKLGPALKLCSMIEKLKACR